MPTVIVVSDVFLYVLEINNPFCSNSIDNVGLQGCTIQSDIYYEMNLLLICGIFKEKPALAHQIFLLVTKFFLHLLGLFSQFGIKHPIINTI